jgi:uncharacterized protein
MNHGRLMRASDTLCRRATQAVRPSERLRGLLGCSRLDDDEALWLAPCNAVHTIGMSMPIDIVLLAQDGTVLAVHGNVVPWRFRMHWRAVATVELGAGRARTLGLCTGQKLRFIADDGSRGKR